MKLRSTASLEPDEREYVEAPVTRECVSERVRRYTRLRAAHRALTPSAPELMEQADRGSLRGIRERLRELTAHFEDGAPEPPPLHDALRAVDDALAGYRRKLLAVVERTPLAQLRASLSGETHPQRVEVSALLQLCLDAEPVPARYLRPVDFLVTLLCGGLRDGKWVMELDPADLNEAVRERCGARSALDSSAEAPIVRRFQQAAERITSGGDSSAITREMAAYKSEIAAFYFEPSVLRCIVGYNVAARNHFEDRLRRGREIDSAIDDELGLFAPLLDDDPRAKRGPGLPVHEAPGVIAVQEAIRRRLLGEDGAEGPADRVAATLDLGWLEPTDREAFLDPRSDGIPRLVRMTVVLGHLALASAEHGRDLAALSLHESQLDAWVGAVGDEAQREVDTLIRGNEYDGAVRLGQTKSRFLAAARVVARRRQGRGVGRPDASETLDHEALGLLRESLERERLRESPRVFFDLLGGGWKRTAAFSALGLLIAGLAIPELVPSSDPRRVDHLGGGALGDVSSLLESGYRDHAEGDTSMFIGTVSERWARMGSEERRQNADLIRDRVAERGVGEVLLFDAERVLQAHWVSGQWLTASGFSPAARTQ